MSFAQPLTNRMNSLGSLVAIRRFSRAIWMSPKMCDNTTLRLHALAEVMARLPAADSVQKIVCDVSLTPQELALLFEWGLDRRVEIIIPAGALPNVAPFLPKTYRDGPSLVFGCGRAGKAQFCAKRVLDVIASFVGLIILLPLLLIAGILIRLESAGSPVFVQERVGVEGRPFRLWKLRSMSKNTNAARHFAFMTEFVQGQIGQGNNGGIFKPIDRPEVTRIGRFLRRFSLDELPQLLNVLRGEMSLVGPRPVPVYEAKLYSQWHNRRHRVRPGMTGLWQVYARSRVPFQEMMLLDVIYAYNWSFGLDIRLLLNTLPAAVRSTGAF